MQTGQRVALTGMVVSGLLAVAKIIAGVAGDSTSAVADGIESAGDVFTSGFVLLGLSLAAKPADENHPYGHGRIEIITGLLIGLVLCGAGAVISYRSLESLGHLLRQPALFVIWPLAASALAKGGLAGMKFHYGRKLKSAALVADAWNDSVDILSATVALAAVGLSIWNPGRFLAADKVGGFLVGLIVIFTGMRVAWDTIMQLIDTMPDQLTMNAIRSVALQVPGVCGVEKCFARKTGLKYHVDLHLEVDPEMTVRASHDLATVVRDRIKEDLDWVADVLVHVEPAG